MIKLCDTYVMLAMTAQYISNKSMAPLAWWKNRDRDFFFFFSSSIQSAISNERDNKYHVDVNSLWQVRFSYINSSVNSICQDCRHILRIYTS